MVELCRSLEYEECTPDQIGAHLARLRTSLEEASAFIKMEFSSAAEAARPTQEANPGVISAGKKVADK